MKRYITVDVEDSSDSDSNNKVSDYKEEDSDDSNDYKSEKKRKTRQRAAKHKKKRYVEEDDDSISEVSLKADDSDYEVDEDCEPEDKKVKGQKNAKVKPLTEYEKLVQKNKDEKMAFLESLKIDEVKGNFYEAMKRRKTRRILKEKPPIVPRLRIERSTKVDIDLSEEAIEKRVISKAVEESRAKKLPPVLPFKDALSEGDLYEDFIEDYSGLDEGNTEPLDNYVSHFQNMKLQTIDKFEDHTLSSLIVHPMREKTIIACSGFKKGILQFFNVNSDSSPYALEPHSKGITWIKFNPEYPHLIVSSSYDGTLRCGDLVKTVFNELHDVSEVAGCYFFDFLSHNTFLVAQSNGTISVVDQRRKSKTPAKTHKCHDVPVKSVGVHPLNKTYFFSAESKGIIKLWDLRKLQKQPVTDVKLKNVRSRLQYALFSPVTGNSVLISSHDGRLSILDTSKLETRIRIKDSRVINCLTAKGNSKWCAAWLPNTDDAFVMGINVKPRLIGVYDDKYNSIFNFADKQLNVGTTFNNFHPSLPVLVGASIAGKVYVFEETGF